MTRKSKSRAPLRSLRTSAAFRDFVLDQLSDLPALSARSMFGGVGLYSGEVFFGLIAAGVLYLKVNDATRPSFEAAGSSAFKPYGGPGAMSSYFNVPLDVLEHAPTLVVWARRAVEVARAAATPGRRR
ncbi:MAG TPA: TfoX/Sxy family protein [Vicinamibacterales bacterium]|nr:TfoX/Sxy family protein [Vicinamibacterales bacterium]